MPPTCVPIMAEDGDGIEELDYASPTKTRSGANSRADETCLPSEESQEDAENGGDNEDKEGEAVRISDDSGDAVQLSGDEEEEGEVTDDEEEKNKDDEKEEGELEDGEIDDDDEEEEEEERKGQIPDRKLLRVNEEDKTEVCKHFVRGTCTWGSSCNFAHPSDARCGERRRLSPIRPSRSSSSTSVSKGGHSTESDWERALRQAKEMNAQASRRKEDPEFERKRMEMQPSDEMDRRTITTASEDSDGGEERRSGERRRRTVPISPPRRGRSPDEYGSDRSGSRSPPFAASQERHRGSPDGRKGQAKIPSLLDIRPQPVYVTTVQRQNSRNSGTLGPQVLYPNGRPQRDIKRDGGRERDGGSRRDNRPVERTREPSRRDDNRDRNREPVQSSSRGKSDGRDGGRERERRRSIGPSYTPPGVSPVSSDEDEGTPPPQMKKETERPRDPWERKRKTSPARGGSDVKRRDERRESDNGRSRHSSGGRSRELTRTDNRREGRSPRDLYQKDRPRGVSNSTSPRGAPRRDSRGDRKERERKREEESGPVSVSEDEDEEDKKSSSSDSSSSSGSSSSSEDEAPSRVSTKSASPALPARYRIPAGEGGDASATVSSSTVTSVGDGRNVSSPRKGKRPPSTPPPPPPPHEENEEIETRAVSISPPPPPPTPPPPAPPPADDNKGRTPSPLRDLSPPKDRKKQESKQPLSPRRSGGSSGGEEKKRTGTPRTPPLPSDSTSPSTSHVTVEKTKKKEGKRKREATSTMSDDDKEKRRRELQNQLREVEQKLAAKRRQQISA